MDKPLQLFFSKTSFSYMPEQVEKNRSKRKRKGEEKKVRERSDKELGLDTTRFRSRKCSGEKQKV